jgi:nitrite reductase/ring-hydroxylating ferredoxin subunit
VKEEKKVIWANLLQEHLKYLAGKGFFDMERGEFLEKIGLGAAFALTATCLNSCSNADVTPGGPAATVNITIDLSASSSAALTRNGGYIIKNSIVIAKSLSGQYLAASSVCTHQGGQVVYDPTSNDWYCGTHGAEYNLQTGAGLNSYGQNGLKIYSTSLSGNILTIT